ncbi:retrovirus-related pol polyprotein from transposon TNT 1-94 [Tanacetum coccineum]
MLSGTKVPLFLWAEAIATACFTQNRSLVIPRHEKTPYHIINGLKQSVKFFHIFGSLCYIVRDGENLDKMKEKYDAYHVSFDPTPQCSTMALEQGSLSSGPQSQENVPQAAKTVTTSNELDFLFSSMFDELLNGILKLCQNIPPLNIQTTPETTSQALTQAPTVTANGNIIQAKTNKEYAQVDEDEFINIFKHHLTKDHLLEQVIGNPSQSIRTRRQLETDGEMYMFALTVSQTEPKNIREAMTDSAWIEAMQEELHQFDRLDEEVYVNQPDGFVDPHHPNKVYRLKKALYGLKQAPRAWYDELSNFLVSKWFSKGSIDPTLLITKKGEDILLVQIYVDEIIFGSMNPKLSKRFEKLMHNKFEMSLMGELKFFLGIQIHQSLRGIFINQAKYAQEILIKHGMTSCDSIGTPMDTKHLDADVSGTPVDQTKYRSMVRALMYLTASGPDIVHATCYCARYQARPTEKHLTVVKRIFWYLKNTINMGLWYSKDTGFELTAFSDSDYASCLDSRLQFHYLQHKSCMCLIMRVSSQVTLVEKLQTRDYGFATLTKYLCIVKKGIVELFFVITKYQLADLFTKALPEDRFKYLVRRLDMRCLTPKELEVLANEYA